MFRRSRRYVTLSNIIYYLNIEEKSSWESLQIFYRFPGPRKSCLPKKERTRKGNHLPVL